MRFESKQRALNRNQENENGKREAETGRNRRRESLQFPPDKVHLGGRLAIGGQQRSPRGLLGWLCPTLLGSSSSV